MGSAESEMEQETETEDDQQTMIGLMIKDWVVVPIVIALCVIVAFGMVLTMAGLHELPEWVYTLPGAPALIIYYGLKMWRLWHPTFRTGTDLSTNVLGQVGQQQTDRGSIAPIISGRGNHTTILMQHPAEATTVPDAPVQEGRPLHTEIPGGSEQTARSSAVPGAIKNGPGAIPVLTEEIAVEGADHEVRQLELERGDRVEGIIRSDAPIDVFMMTEDEYAEYWENDDPSRSDVWMLDETSSRVRWRARKTATWYVVFDTFGKQNPRLVDIMLRKIPKNGP